MESVLISIKPKWCKLIASGKKTVEIRKTRPKIETPFKCYIYCAQDFADSRTRRKRNEFWIGEPLNNVSKGRYIGNGMVIGEFVCDYILEITLDPYGHHEYFISDDDLNASCLNVNDLWRYANGKTLYGWHISDLVICDKLKELSEFRKPLNCHRGIQQDNCVGCWDCEIKRPPQSWCYVEEPL